ncbi:MAG: PEGA domain-containing protein [Planctomycetaceae bacterium]
MFLPPGQKQILAIAAIMLLMGGGCVSRRMTVRTEPSGALVEINGKRVGTTPASMDFTYYGTYEIRISKPGYETKTIHQPVLSPWYQVPPIDFLSDNLSPVQLTNRHEFIYPLTPAVHAHQEESTLDDRAENFRSQARTGQ